MDISMKFVNGNPAMSVIYEEGLKRLENHEQLAPAQRIVMNEVLTRMEARASEIELHHLAGMKDKERLTPDDELRQLREQISKLKDALKES